MREKWDQSLFGAYLNVMYFSSLIDTKRDTKIHCKYIYDFTILSLILKLHNTSGLILICCTYFFRYTGHICIPHFCFLFT